jgi:hypothetical protein
MQAHIWGLKTFYYSLINKQGAKAKEGDEVVNFMNGNKTKPEFVYTEADVNGFEDDCEACKL